jgi:hypothetical protein
VAEVNVQGKQKNRQDGKLQHQPMVVGSPDLFRLLVVSYAMDETLERKSTQRGERAPSDKQHDQGEEQGIFRRGLLVADVEDEQNNDKIDDVVEHAISTGFPPQFANPNAALKPLVSASVS